MTYELKRHTEQLGPLSIELETVADLDRAIDQLCLGVDEKSAAVVFTESLCPYFGVVWPAARALAGHLARMGSWLQGKTLLELGCGLALPSLAAAKLGARVTATDFHPDVPGFLERNLRLNGVSADAIRYRERDWRAPGSDLGTFDFVVGSDILYEAHHPEAVALALASHCARGSHIVLADPGRVYLQPCVDALKASGFHGDLFVNTVADTHHDRAGDKATKEVFVMVLQKR